MKLLKLCLFLFLFIRINSAIMAQEIGKKVLFVIVDGIAADVLERVNTPYIDLISKDGGYSRAYMGGEKGGYSQTPTVSAVGYNSLLTGTWVNKHNVWDNDIEDPNYHYWTIFRFLKEQFLEKKAAVYSTWLDNRTKLIGEGLPQTGGIEIDYSFDGLELDTINFPHEDEFYIQKIDEKDHGGQTEREKTIWISCNSKALNKYFYAGRPAIVDILPSIADYMGMEISKHQKMELDGVSLLGEISVAHPETKISGNELIVFWEAYQDNEKVKIWLANTNEFNTSGKINNYKLVGETDILEEQFIIPLKGKRDKFFKIVIEGKHNMINRWFQME